MGESRVGDRDVEQATARREALRALLPTVERVRAARDVDWGGGEPTGDGAYTVRFPEYDEATLALMAAFQQEPLVVYEYVSWLERRGLDEVGDVGALVADADDHLVRALLTRAVRSERFCDGAVAAALRDGSLLALVDRLTELYELPAPRV